MDVAYKIWFQWNNEEVRIYITMAKQKSSVKRHRATVSGSEILQPGAFEMLKILMAPEPVLHKTYILSPLICPQFHDTPVPGTPFHHD